MNVLLCTAYWPNLYYVYHLLNAEHIILEKHAHFQKQSYSTRTRILSANGVLDLNIPVVHTHKKEVISGARISYNDRWQIIHWRAITSAYRNSPYFEFFESDVHEIYLKRTEFLFDYNLQQLQTLFRILKVEKKISFTTEYHSHTAGTKDLRSLHPSKPTHDEEVSRILAKPYYQTFSNKFPFAPNLSILDLIFNTGLGTLEYLK
jgi:hypothetical protein